MPGALWLPGPKTQHPRQAAGEGPAAPAWGTPVAEAQEGVLAPTLGTRQAPVGDPVCKARTHEGHTPGRSAWHPRVDTRSQEETQRLGPSGRRVPAEMLGQEGPWGCLRSAAMEQTQPSCTPGDIIKQWPPSWLSPEEVTPHLQRLRPVSCKRPSNPEQTRHPCPPPHPYIWSPIDTKQPAGCSQRFAF